MPLQFPIHVRRSFLPFIIIYEGITDTCIYSNSSQIFERDFLTLPFLPHLVLVKHRRCRPYQWKSSALRCLLASQPSHVRPLVLRRPKIATIGDLPWLNLSLHEIGMFHSKSPKHLQQILPVLFPTSRLRLPAKHTTAIYSTKSVTPVFPSMQSR